MKGLTPAQLTIITEFTQKHHKFGYIPEEDRLNGSLGMCIKYIDTTYDTRDMTFFAITFRQGADGIRFSVNTFLPIFSNTPKDITWDNLFDWIMAWLNGEWHPTEKHLKYMKK